MLTPHPIVPRPLPPPVPVIVIPVPPEPKDPSSPDAPMMLYTSVTVPSTKTVNLSWDAIPGADDYQISRGTRVSNLVPMTNVVGTSHVDTGLHNEVTYYYQVRARIAGVLQPPSNMEFATPRNLLAIPAYWPSVGINFILVPLKTWGAESADDRWLHLHHGHASVPDEEYVGLRVAIYNIAETPAEQDPSNHQGIQVRYLVRGEPVSAWLPLPAPLTLSVHHDDATPELAALPDGFSDVSVEVQYLSGPWNVWDYTVRRSFLHMTRHNNPVSTLVPSFSEPVYYGPDSGPGVVYIDTTQLVRTGRPADPTTTAWTAPPHETDLYVTMKAPVAGFFSTAPLLWQDPPHPSQPFIRGWEPIRGQHYIGDALRVQMGHEKFPILDGPRGVGWTSPYSSGQVDSLGGFMFAETQGAIRYLEPNGTLRTICGWVYPATPGLPVWPTKPLSTIRSFQEFRGTWLDGLDDAAHQGDNRGMHTPLDVAADPRDPNTWYVTAAEDHCIWKVVITDRITWAATVSVFAGDPYHSPGHVDALGPLARFNSPFSLVWKQGTLPADDILYVTDHENDCLRAITRAGLVTTVAGSPGQIARMQSRGAGSPYDAQPANRTYSNFLEQTYAGVPALELFKPQVVRLDSLGRLLVLDLGFGSIRRLDLAAGTATLIVNTWQKFPDAGEFGWAWFDVDKWGNSGPLDGIYWCKSNGQNIEGDGGGTFQHFNEVYAWSPATGGGSRFFLGDRWSPWSKGWGRASQCQGGHYPWVLAVDPRGGVYLGGFGANGLSYLRAKRPADQTPSAFFPGGYYDGRAAWTHGYATSNYTSRPLEYERSLILTFGQECHNYLGMPDGWDLTGNETDDELFQLFQVPLSIRSDLAFRSPFLEYVRQSKGH